MASGWSNQARRPHRQAGDALLGLFTQEMALPVVAQHKMGLAHVPQAQRHGNTPHFVPIGTLDLNAPIADAGGLLHQLQQASERRSPHFFHELGMGRKLVRQGLPEEVIESLFEAGATGGCRVSVGVRA